MIPEVIEALAAELARVGNPSSLHSPGRAARGRVEEARESLADALGATASEVVFTSGGTESDNLAVTGMFRRRRSENPARRRVLVGATEHPAVLDTAEALVRDENAQVTLVPCTPEGLITPEALASALRGPEDRVSDDVALVTIMWVNNEIGVVQPIAELAAVAHEHGVPLHTDAVQAVGQVPVDFADSGADAMTVSGHKCGGPSGVGLLVARRDAPIAPISFGGGQERSLRSGTLATHLVAGLAAAIPPAVARQQEQAIRLVALRDSLIEGVLERVPGSQVTGVWTPGDGERRSPANAHVLLPECQGDSLLFLLDAAGIACSTGSACHAGVPRPSHVVLALGYTEQEAQGALRLTLGHDSTAEDVAEFLSALPNCVERAQRAYRAAAARRAG